MYACECGSNNYEWTVDDKLRSWLKCADCGTNFFDDGIGVVLINWDTTDIDRINIEDVLRSTAHDNGVITGHDE